MSKFKVGDRVKHSKNHGTNHLMIIAISSESEDGIAVLDRYHFRDLVSGTDLPANYTSAWVDRFFERVTNGVEIMVELA